MLLAAVSNESAFSLFLERLTSDYARLALAGTIAVVAIIVLIVQTKAWLAPLAGFGLFCCVWWLYSHLAEPVTSVILAIAGLFGNSLLTYDPSTDPLFVDGAGLKRLFTIFDPRHWTIAVGCVGIIAAFLLRSQTKEWNDKLGNWARRIAMFSTYVGVVVIWCLIWHGPHNA